MTWLQVDPASLYTATSAASMQHDESGEAGGAREQRLLNAIVFTPTMQRMYALLVR